MIKLKVSYRVLLVLVCILVISALVPLILLNLDNLKSLNPNPIQILSKNEGDNEVKIVVVKVRVLLWDGKELKPVTRVHTYFRGPMNYTLLRELEVLHTEVQELLLSLAKK
ncbi:MAG: hypothetical protein DRJ40_00790 [Thermoprotei archaeon]|nr:MAG: hypothetical protein DRJ40_00790 [Thermoprotei archaeon]